MDTTDLRINMESLGILEASILSAHIQFFKRNSGVNYHLTDEESALYETVIRYFTGNS